MLFVEKDEIGVACGGCVEQINASWVLSRMSERRKLHGKPRRK